MTSTGASSSSSLSPRTSPFFSSSSYSYSYSLAVARGCHQQSLMSSSHGGSRVERGKVVHVSFFFTDRCQSGARRLKSGAKGLRRRRRKKLELLSCLSRRVSSPHFLSFPLHLSRPLFAFRLANMVRLSSAWPFPRSSHPGLSHLPAAALSEKRERALDSSRARSLLLRSTARQKSRSRCCCCCCFLRQQLPDGSFRRGL